MSSKLILKLVREVIGGVIDSVRTPLFRLRQLRRGVLIHRRCRVIGGSGIRLGRGTAIDADVTLSAALISPSGRYSTPSSGRIMLGPHCRVLRFAILACYGGDITLGERVTINPYCVLYGHGGLVIGDRTLIAAHTVIIPANHVFADPDAPIASQGLTCKGVRIGSDVWLGTGVRVLDGVTIGDGAVVGAGAVVTKDVGPYDIVVGVPARKVGSRRPDQAPSKATADATTVNDPVTPMR